LSTVLDIPVILPGKGITRIVEKKMVGDTGFEPITSKGWTKIIRKVYGIDPLLRPSSGGKMSIISFIDDHKVIDKIIAHLELRFETERPPPPQVVQQELQLAAEEMGEYFWHLQE
jgi:hypothetical protein